MMPGSTGRKKKATGLPVRGRAKVSSLPQAKGRRKRPAAAKKRAVSARRKAGSGRQHRRGRLLAQAAGAAAGREAARAPQEGEGNRAVQVSRAWAQWWNHPGRKRQWRLYSVLSRRFLKSYCRAAGKRIRASVLLPTEKSVSAIVNAPKANPNVTAVLDQLARLPLDEVIVVMSGPAEGVWQLVAAHHAQPTLIYLPEPLSDDAGRAIGAKAAASDIMIFLGEDSAIGAEGLLPFIRSVAGGSDMALYDASLQISFGRRGSFSSVSEWLNYIQGRHDLGPASLVFFPHALSRKAVEQLSPAQLAVPAVAQTAALQLGLKVTGVSPGKTGKVRTMGLRPSGQSREEMLLGDSLEAFQEHLRHAGKRSAYPDRIRRRELAKEATTCV